MKTKKKTKKPAALFRVRVESDGDLENPCDFDGQWTPYSFGRRHSNYHDPEQLGLSLERDEATGLPKVEPENEDLRPKSEELKRKLENGLAFFLAYYEHGGSIWSLTSDPRRNRCQFDSVSVAGLLVWENADDDMGAKTVEERAKDAQSFLDTYNAWCNGEGLGYAVEKGVKCDHGDVHWEDTESCWGYFSNDVEHVFDEIYSALPEDVREKPDAIQWAGDLAYLADSHWPKALERATSRKARGLK